jgi:hypothetical protein
LEKSKTTRRSRWTVCQMGSLPGLALPGGGNNFACGYLLVSRADRKADAKADQDAWLLPLLAGGVFSGHRSG